ncbi:hypothetical protein M1N18_01030 [Dehalococcoidales bacterium]|nr:hypothetical protein [Dehalococcoidales bacterium]MCL0094407.1 hypothetical protein [Dehalococcoidales bacterium]
MEVARGIVGAALAVLGLILAYIWRANGRYIRELQAGQKEIARGIGNMAVIGKVVALYYLIQLRREVVPENRQDILKELD